MGDATPALDIKEPKSKVYEYTGKITDNPAPPDEKYEEPIFAKEPRSSEIFGDNVSANLLNMENRELHELHILGATNDQIDGFKRNVLWIIFLGALVVLLQVNIIIKLLLFFGGFLLKRYDDSQSNTNSTRQSSCERPAAGAGGSSTNPPAPAARGRRHVRKTIFENECNEYGLSMGPAAGLGPQSADVTGSDNQEIFSIKGTRSIKINRHRDTVNVFPSGCMGIPQDALPKIPEDMLSGAALVDLNETPDLLSPKKDGDDSSLESTPRGYDEYVAATATTPKKTNATLSDDESPVLTPRSVTQNGSNNSVQFRRSRPLSAVQRNPLTGVGYEDRDFIRQSAMKKRDGNPVLGQGYENKDANNKSKKIPPGGYSRGLW